MSNLARQTLTFLTGRNVLYIQLGKLVHSRDQWGRDRWDAYEQWRKKHSTWKKKCLQFFLQLVSEETALVGVFVVTVVVVIGPEWNASEILGACILAQRRTQQHQSAPSFSFDITTTTGSLLSRREGVLFYQFSGCVCINPLDSLNSCLALTLIGNYVGPFQQDDQNDNNNNATADFDGQLRLNNLTALKSRQHEAAQRTRIDSNHDSSWEGDQAGRQAGSQPGRWTDRQTDTQTSKQGMERENRSVNVFECGGSERVCMCDQLLLLNNCDRTDRNIR